MPWRSKLLSPRRHPVALSAYAVIFLLGLLFVAHVYRSDAIDALLGGPFWRFAWSWLLTVGGGLSFAGALWLGELDFGLWLERVGATASAFGLVTYSTATTYAVGFSAPPWLLLGSLALGCLVRAIQITREMARIKRAVQQLTNSGPQ